MDASNTEAELEEKRAIYRCIGAEEVWIVDEEGGTLRFSVEGEMERSEAAPACPRQVQS